MQLKGTLLAAGAMSLFASSTAWSIPVGTVGSLDQLIAQTNLGNSGDATEAHWVSDVLGIAFADLVYEEKTNVTGSDWSTVDGHPGVWAFELSSPADWFLIKTGNLGNLQPNRHFLFTNLANFDYAVVRLADMGITRIDKVGKISHVGEFTGPRTEVPEPATLSLLLAGLGAMAFLRRKAKI
jgi:hypothetical protein